jgi:hypothetical protein
VHWRDKTCAADGCTSRYRLQVHHIRQRAHGGDLAPPSGGHPRARLQDRPHLTPTPAPIHSTRPRTRPTTLNGQPSAISHQRSAISHCSSASRCDATADANPTRRTNRAHPAPTGTLARPYLPAGQWASARAHHLPSRQPDGRPAAT